MARREKKRKRGERETGDVKKNRGRKSLGSEVSGSKCPVNEKVWDGK